MNFHRIDCGGKKMKCCIKLFAENYYSLHFFFPFFFGYVSLENQVVDIFVLIQLILINYLIDESEDKRIF